MDELLEILEDIKPGVEFEGQQHLIDNGVLASLDIVSLVNELNDEFDIEISVVDVIPENFNSVDAIWALVQRLQDDE